MEADGPFTDRGQGAREEQPVVVLDHEGHDGRVGPDADSVTGRLERHASGLHAGHT
jgi:hypothetical protein